MPIVWPEALDELMQLLKNLPGIGKRSAERMALSMYHWDAKKLSALAENLATLHDRIHPCSVCGNLADAAGGGLCAVCASPLRDRGVICVVEEPQQVNVIETAGVYKGLYHVLGGRIAPLEGKFPDSISIPQLDARLASGEAKELILALSQDIEGQATAFYLANRFKDKGLRITRLSQGLPAGADLTYADAATLAIALNARTSVEGGNHGGQEA